jgi:hypothetical protein
MGMGKRQPRNKSCKTKQQQVSFGNFLAAVNRFNPNLGKIPPPSFPPSHSFPLV